MQISHPFIEMFYSYKDVLHYLHIYHILTYMCHIIAYICQILHNEVTSLQTNKRLLHVTFWQT